MDNNESNPRSETSNQDLQLIQQPSTPRALATTSPEPAASSPNLFEQLVSRYIDPEFMRKNFPNIENLNKYIISGTLTVGAAVLMFALEISNNSGSSHASFDSLQNFLLPQALSFIPFNSITASVAIGIGIGCLNNGPTGRTDNQLTPSTGEAASSNALWNFEFSTESIEKKFQEYLEGPVDLRLVRIIRCIKIVSSTLQTMKIGAKLWHFCKKVLLVDELKEENAIVLEIRKNLLKLGELMTEGQQILDGKLASGMDKLQLNTDKMRQIINKITPLLENAKLKVNGKLQDLVAKNDGMWKRSMILGGISLGISIALSFAFGLYAGPVSKGAKLAMVGKTATVYAASTGLILTLDYNITSEELVIARATFEDILQLIKDLDVMVEKVTEFQETLIDLIDQPEANNGLIANHNQAQVPVTSLPRQQLTQ